jgi:hypothetical protein
MCHSHNLRLDVARRKYEEAAEAEQQSAWDEQQPAPPANDEKEPELEMRRPSEELRKIAANRSASRKLVEQIRQRDDELAELIRAAFDAGHTGPQIAAAAGLSTPRTYQIRDGRR